VSDDQGGRPVGVELPLHPGAVGRAIAQGEPLSLRQEDLQQRGHSIECRVYAEDPDAGFLPSPGTILALRVPGGPGVRDDSGVYEGFAVPIDYDPLLSKLVVWAESRDAALRRMRRAVEEYRVVGVKTTLPLFERVLAHPAFVAGDFDTSFLDTTLPAGKTPRGREVEIAVAVAAIMLGPGHVLVDIGVFFSKLAVVSFGGAYALLAYMAQEAVESYRWMTAPEMVDGLGLAETTPGPLILVTQFVGFLAGFRDAAPFSPVAAGILASALTTWVTFVPPMMLIFAGAPFVEQLRANQRLSGALAAITAAVVGVILNLTVWFALHVLFGHVEEVRAGPLRWYAFDPGALDLKVVALALVAALLAFGLRRGLVELVLVMAALGIAVRLAFGG